MLEVQRRFLREERGARGRGIPRGSIGIEDATELCGGSMPVARRDENAPVHPSDAPRCAPIRRGLTERERADWLATRLHNGARDESRQFGLCYGADQLAECDRRRRVIGETFTTWRAGIDPSFNVQRPARLHTGPVKERKERKERGEVKAARAEERRSIETQERDIEAKARAGLDFTDPRHVARYKARLERLHREAESANTLDAFDRFARATGGTATATATAR